ncbi:MAG: insulinase family protein [Eubacterium sp.]|nr:insulinase family protein [Eubacterium sp.]
MKNDLEKLGTYTITQVNQLDEVNGTGFVLSHNKTKARVSVVVNDDDNKVFAIGFRTPPTNSKGIQHIVEHTVLCGSKKYPAKDPFVELAKGSLNTFLNAMTYGDKTVYPIASCNEKDFRNLMDVYLDAVFNPNIYSREEIFKQEGWHYELADKDSDIIINGVVYNEMRGVYSSPDSVLANVINQKLYPDTVYSVDSGGDPDVIPSLTREEYLDYHKNYYHPSNSYIYLYGNLNPAEQLEYIDKEYLADYDYLYVPSEIPLQKSFSEPVSYTTYYSVADEEELEKNSILSYNVVVGESKDKILTEAMNILQFILIDSPGAPLKKKIIDSGICSDVEAQYDSSMRQPMFTIVAREANAEDQDKFNSIIEEQLKSYVENGLDKLALEAALNNFEFRAKEASFGRFPKGLALGLDAFESWLYDDELVQDKFSVQNVYSYLRKGIIENLLNPEDKTKGFFEELIERCILDNNHKAYITGVPSVGLNQKKDAELAQKMSQYKKTLSDTEIEKLIADTAHLKQYQTEPSTPQELATIPLLSIDDINKKVRPVVNTEEEVCGVKTIKHDIFTNGISYLDMYFRIDDLDFEDLSKAELLFELLKYVDTDEHTYNELSTLINLNTGGVVFTLGTMYREEGSFTYALCKAKTFDNKVNDGIDLINEVITTSHITDKKRIREILSEIKAAGKNTLVEGGHVTARGRAGSYVMLTQKIMEALDGVDYYRFIDYVDKNLDDIYDELAQDLTRIYKKIFRKKSLIISYTSKNEVTALEEGLNRLLPRLSDDDVEDKQFNPVLEVKNEGFKTASKVQYVATAANFKKAGLEYTGALNVLQIIFSYDYLWINVRVKGGAYGAMCDFTRSGLAFMTSYRDPNLGETYQIYKNAADYVENFDCSDRDMVKYIIGTVAKMDAPLTPAMEGVFSFGCYISEITDEERQKSRDEVLSATQEKIRNLAPFVKVLSDSDVICAVGSEDKINESSELFKEITKLF